MDLKFLEFEQPIAELEARIDALKFVGDDSELNISEEISRLRNKSESLTRSIFSSLTAWQIAQLARHPQRPYTLDYVEKCFTDFQELHGDRMYADDHSLVGGLARLDGEPVVVIGHQKGRDTKERVWRNYGMARPEGYRKGLRLMKLAEKFGLPLITLIDTPGAYPGIGAEERGQSEAIARNLFVMSSLKVPIISVVIGEGGSGGALAIGVADRVLMLQYSIYSVISPEGCASILWKSADKAELAAEAMGITAERLHQAQARRRGDPRAARRRASRPAGHGRRAEARAGADARGAAGHAARHAARRSGASASPATESSKRSELRRRRRPCGAHERSDAKAGRSEPETLRGHAARGARRAGRRRSLPPRMTVAFSGGLDSTVLLAALCRLDLPARVRAAHVDHGLHPRSADWSAHCAAAAAALGVEFVAVARRRRPRVRRRARSGGARGALPRARRAARRPASGC